MYPSSNWGAVCSVLTANAVGTDKVKSDDYFSSTPLTSTAYGGVMHGPRQ